MKIYDVAIIGSGPAGASAAFELSKHGISTVIIEKEILPRYKTCGGGFVYRGVKNMPFDIESVVETTFREVDIYFGNKDVKVTTKRDLPIITMVMRDTFDNLIVSKAKENGVSLLQGHKVLDIEFDAIQTIKTSEGDIEAKFIIAADGALSPTAKMAGWKETRNLIPALEYEIEVPEADFERLSATVRFDIDAAPAGYGWCFPKQNHLSVGVGALRDEKQRLDLKKHYRDYLEKLGITTILKEAAHGFVIPISPRTDGFVRNNVFLIGDAAGLADPLVAEGISNAILSGVMVAKAIAESKLNPEIASKLYLEKLEEFLLPELRTGMKFSKIFYEQKIFRNFLSKKQMQIAAEAMTDLFMGDRTYPVDYKASLKRKFKKIIFS